VIALVRRSFERVVRPLLAIGVLLSAFQIALIASASSIAADGNVAGLAQLIPGFLHKSLGLALVSFAGLTTLGFFDAVIVMIVVLFAIFLGTEPAGDIEAGYVDLILARPLPRHWIVSRSVFLMTASVAALMLAMGLALWLALAWLAPSGAVWPQANVVITMAAHLTMVSLSFGAVGLAAAAWAKRRGSAMLAVGVAAMALYLLDFLATMWKPIAGLARVSPFYYFHGGEILAGTARAGLDLAVLSAITIGAIALAYWQHARRDL
jgi:ABC-2 type transport system permease protein